MRRFCPNQQCKGQQLLQLSTMYQQQQSGRCAAHVLCTAVWLCALEAPSGHSHLLLGPAASVAATAAAACAAAAGALFPCVMHVAARTLASDAMSMFCDHQDVMAARQTGWAMVASADAQVRGDLGQMQHLLYC
jgi:hypothetical protein